MTQTFLNKRRFVAFSVAAVLAALLLVGCGGDGSEGSASGGGGSGSGGSPPGGSETGESASGGSANTGNEVAVQTGSLSKAQFIKKADAICEKDRSQREREFGTYTEKRSSQSKSSAGAAEVVNTIVVPIYEKQIDRIRSLGAPSGDEEEVASILSAIQQGLDEGKDEPLKFIGSGAPFGEAPKLAKAYGFTACGSP